MIPEWSEDVVRAVSAFVRTELQAPVARLSGMIDILAEDAADAGLTAYEKDLLKMRPGPAASPTGRPARCAPRPTSFAMTSGLPSPRYWVTPS